MYALIIYLFGYFLYETKQKFPQIIFKTYGFEDIDGRKLSLKYYLLRCCIVFKKWVKQFHKKKFRLSDTKII